MSKDKKIGNFVEVVERLILEGAPGFTDRLPGQREIAAKFRLSQSSVHIGLAELEKRGLIRTVPYKGTLVTLEEFRAGSRHKSKDKAGILNLVVCEDMIHQRDFWMETVKSFEDRNPGTRVKVRFFSAHTVLERAVAGDSNCVVIRPADYRRTPLPLVPLRELLPDETLRQLKENFLPGIPAPDWSVALPYQLQVPSVIYDSRNTRGIPPDTDIMLYLDWVSENLGEHSLPVPDLNFLRDNCGLDRVSMLGVDKSGISGELRRFFRILEKTAQLRLVNLGCAEPDETFRQLLAGEVKCVELFSHHWGGKSAGMPLHFRFAPPPQAGQSGVNFFLATAILAGRQNVSEAEKAFFHYLASPRFQDRMLHRCLGLSPYANVLSAYRPEADEPDLSRVAAWVRTARFTDTTGQLFDQVWYDVVKKLRTPVIVPLLLGRLSAAGAEKIILTNQLLAESYMEDALAENLYAFGKV